MLTINNYLRSYTEKNPQRIWAVFYIEGKIFKINTNQHIKPSDWSKDKQKAKQNTKLNTLLKEQSEFIEKHIEALKLKKKRLYRDELQAEFNRHFKIGENISKKESEIVDFVSFIEDYINNRKHIAEGTTKNNTTTKKHLYYCFEIYDKKLMKQYKAMKKPERKEKSDFLIPKKQIDFDQVDYKFMEQFHKYLLDATFTQIKKGIKITKSYSKNFIAKQIKNAQQFANAAVKAGYIQNISFRGFEAAYEDADAIHLSWDEISMLKNLELDHNSTHGKIRDLFVFNCYLGLRYSDLYKLNKNRFTRLKDQLFIKLRMKKTDDLINFPILNSAEDILKIYDYNLPVISEGNFNEEIKKICLKAGISNLETKRETRGGEKLILTIPKYEMVSTHTGRRSFATIFYEDGVPIKQLMSVTGHATETSFMNYVRSKRVAEFTEFIAIGGMR